MTEIEVVVVSPEEAEYGVAELWLGGEQLGMTIVEDEQLRLRIDPRPDGSPWDIEVAALTRALSDASGRLTAY